MTRSDRRPGGAGGPLQGAQFGDQNVQRNYFAPVTNTLFAGSFERLRDACFDPAGLERDLDLVRFTGREWLIDRIDAFISDHDRGYVVVMGEAGVGKSCLAGHLVGTRPWLHHFTRLPGGRSAEAARKSLAAQLIARWSLDVWAPGGVLPGSAGRPDWFDRLLHDAARRRDASEPGVPIVLVVDGLDEAEPSADGGLPLGLPVSLPDGVFVVATSRFGIDRALHPVRQPADWQQIDVEGADNLDDMRRYIADVLDPQTGDRQLTEILAASGIGFGWFGRTLAERCGGVWIYLRYVVEEIRNGSRDPLLVSRLPGDLAGYYAEQVERWRGDPGDLNAQRRWDRVGLPILGVLGVARAALTVEELASFAGVGDHGAVTVFVEETVRAFLSREDTPQGPARYSVRHQSLRDLLTGLPPDGRPDVTSLARMLAACSQRAHRAIAAALMPSDLAGHRAWRDSGAYARQHLPAHAASAGLLDGLVADPEYLSVVSPGSVLTQRTKLVTAEGRRAIAAFEMSLNGWESCSEAQRADRLASNAARVRAARLLEASAAKTEAEWPLQWAAWSGRSHRTLASNQRRVLAVAIGRAGDRDIIVSGSDDGSVQIWDAVTGEPAAALSGHERAVNAVAIGRAGDRDIIVSGSADHTVRIWDAVTGKQAAPPLSGHERAVNAVAIGRAGDRDIIISGSADRTVRIWDPVTGDPASLPLEGLRSVVYAAAIGQAGGHDVVISGSYDGSVRIWDAVTGKPTGQPMAGHDGSVLALAMGQAGDRDIIVSGSDDCTVRVWDAVTGKPVGVPLIDDKATAKPEAEAVEAVAVGRAGDRDIIISGSADGTVRIWDAVTGDLADTLAAHLVTVNALAIGRAGDRDVIVSGSDDSTVRIWDAAFADPAETALAGHDDAVTAVAIGRAGDRDVIVSGSDDSTVRVWAAISGDMTGLSLAGHDDGVSAMAIGQAGDRDVIVSGSYSGTVRIWDAVTHDPVGSPLHGSDRAIYAVAIGRAAHRDVMVSGSADGTVRVWDAVSHDPASSALHGSDRAVYAVAIGRAGDRDVIVSGSADGMVRVWDAVTGSLTAPPLTGHGDTVRAVAIGRAGNRDVIVSGSADGTVRVWDAVTGSLTAPPLTGHSDTVNAVAIGRVRDRDIIVSGSADATVRVWDAVTGSLTAPPLTGHDDTVNAVAIGRVGDRDVIVSGSDDRTVFLRTNCTAHRTGE